MANKPRKYKNNYTGISTNDVIGKINISKRVWVHLGCPQHIEFTCINHEKLKLSRGWSDDEHVGFVSRQGSGLAIFDADLVRWIYKQHNIIRHDSTVMSPFYIAEYEYENGRPVVYIKMNNFAT